MKGFPTENRKAFLLVGTTGFEPATSRTPSVRATRLRYVPTAQDRKRSKLTGTRLSLAFKERQQTAQRVAQVEQHLAIEMSGSNVLRSSGEAAVGVGGGGRGG